MSFIEIILISIGLASDAFTVALCKGINIKNNILKKFVLISFSFSLAQMLMPLIGYYLGNSMSSFLSLIDHWISFVLLSIIGCNMLYDVYMDSEKRIDDNISFSSLFISSIATSIDALVIGVTFSFYDINLLSVLFTIGIITFTLSFIGVWIGYMFGKRFENISKTVGGLILIFMAFRLLFKHLLL